MNSFNWVRNIMLCNMSYVEVAKSSTCIQQPDTCPEPSEGDVRLASHPRGACSVAPARAAAPARAPGAFRSKRARH
jgi:hypothetical protein